MTTPLGMTFDANQVEPRTGSPDPLPTDWYNAAITASEMKANSKGTGHYLEFTFRVMDGPYANRLFWDRLNLDNPNATAVEIAQGTLSAICHATGVMQVADASVLHNIPLMARVVETPPKKGRDAGNDVKGYAQYGTKPSSNAQGIKLEPEHTGAAVASPTPAVPATAAAAAPPSDVPPWATDAMPAPPAAPTPAPAPVAPPAAPPVAPVAPPVAPAPPAPAPPAPPAAPTAAPPATPQPAPAQPEAAPPPTVKPPWVTE